MSWSNTSIRFRPCALASYIAASASPMSSSAWLVASVMASPTLIEIPESLPS